jgi:hypothetical protein
VNKQDSILQTKKDSLLPKNISLIDNVSIFRGHSLKVTHHSPIINANTQSYWQGILLFILFSIYVVIRVSEPKKILKIFISVFSLQEAKQLFREEFKLTKRIALLLGIEFILIIAFLMQFTNQYFGLILKDYSHLQQYLFFVLVICFVYLIKFLVNYVLALISSSNELGKEYLFNVFIFCQTLGMIIFPLIVLLQLTKYPKEWFLYPALIIYAVFYGLRIFRSFIISATEQNVGFLYIFIYLCALEILPMLVLIKFLLINF